MHRKKIFFVIPSLVGGGAERTVVTLLEHLDRETFEPVLVLFNARGPYLENLPNDIEVIDLKKRTKWDGVWLVVRLLSLIRLRRPAAIVSFLWYADLISILAAKLSRMSIPVVVSARNYLSIELTSERAAWCKRLLIRMLFPMATKVVSVSNMAGQDLVDRFGVEQRNVVVIPNAIDLDRVDSLGREPVDHPWLREDIPVIVAVGRLSTQKGFDFLIRAFAGLLQSASARLVILGEGEERASLEHLIAEFKIGHAVQLLGYVKNPYPYLLRAELFVMSSLFEGFPGVLLEALACGKPVVATCCPSGPAEIITDGVDGLLVPTRDIAALREAMERLLADRTLANQLAACGRSIPEQRFGLPLFIQRFERLLSDVSGSESIGL